VSCELSQMQLHAYFDGELDATSSAAFENHVKSCAECQSALASEEALRTAIGKANLYEGAPANLRRVITAKLPALPSEAPARASASHSWRWLALAASILFLATLGWQLFQHFQGTRGPAPVIVAALDAHLRSLQQGHLADVQSTDQHTVKPWFDGKLDFAPPVRDLAADGFPLVGGRLDVLDGKTVAALVYGRRKHIINVFVRPAGFSGADREPNHGTSQGYNWLTWHSGGFTFCAVSDVNAADLQQLRQLLSAP
jgi:anti-sigma factor (TIGR02949 family)